MEVSDGIPPPLTTEKQNPRERRYPVRCTDWLGHMNIKCNKCGHVGAESEFPKGRDFFQNQYIAGCPKCDNRQSPGDASMRMFGGQRPFERAVEAPPIKVTGRESAIVETFRRADSVS